MAVRKWYPGPCIVGLVVFAELSGCTKPYRVGEYVLVEWEEGSPPYPAYIVEQKGKTRFRVHFEGYESRWDKDVTADRILGRIEGPITVPPPPERVARAAGLAQRAASSASPMAPYREGDRVRVRWRGSVYSATVVRAVASDRFLIHYDGYENAWDEEVDISRIVNRR
ncbi:Tudor-knot domain-containing protein [Myxococcota bacterium]